MREFPFSVNDSEGNVLIRWTSGKVEEHGLVVSRFFNNLVSRAFGLVNKIRIEYIELIGKIEIAKIRKVVRD